MKVRNLDNLHFERVNEIMKDREGRSISDLFASPRVVETFAGEKAFLNGYNLGNVMAEMPFHPSVYVRVCPRCIKPSDFDNFKKVVQSGIVIPVLSGRYSTFPESVVEFLAGQGHINWFEYLAFRYWKISSMAETRLCNHCTEKRLKAIERSIKNVKNFKVYRREVSQIKNNIYPYIDPDNSLLDLAATACKTKNWEQLKYLVRLSDGIYEIRTAQALNCAVTLDEKDLKAIPENYSSDTDATRYEIQQMREYAAEGLGLNIPLNIPVERYVELVKDYQPAIKKILDSIQPDDSDKPISIKDISTKVGQLNEEIEKIENLKRYAVLQAGISFFKQNKGVVTTVLVASAFGAAGSLLGCAATATAAGGIKALKRIGVIKETRESKRATEMVLRDIQPQLDLLMSKYVGASLPAVNVLSLRKKIVSK